jgi:hypothetical protein
MRIIIRITAELQCLFVLGVYNISNYSGHICKYALVFGNTKYEKHIPKYKKPQILTYNEIQQLLL